MISVTFYKADEKICGFEVKNHGKSFVCAAVSALTINTANSIELFSGDPFSLDEENEKHIKFMMEAGPDKLSPETTVLLNSFELGIYSIKSQHEKQIDIRVEAWEV